MASTFRSHIVHPMFLKYLNVYLNCLISPTPLSLSGSQRPSTIGEGRSLLNESSCSGTKLLMMTYSFTFRNSCFYSNFVQCKFKQSILLKSTSYLGTDTEHFQFYLHSVTSFHVFSPVSGTAGRRRGVVIFFRTVNLILHRSRFMTLTPVDTCTENHTG